jgi:translation initiation factor 1A
VKQRELVMRDSDDQVYGVVTSVLGNGRFAVDLIGAETATMQCRIRGKLQRREWVNNGDVVLVARRDFDTTKGDILVRYLATEVAQLRQYGELPDVLVKDDTADLDVDIVFEDI